MRGNIIRRGWWASVDFMKNEMVQTRTTNSNWSKRIKQRFTQARASETSDWTADTVSFADEAQQNAQAKLVDRLFSQLNAFNILNILAIIFLFFLQPTSMVTEHAKPFNHLFRTFGLLTALLQHIQ